MGRPEQINTGEKLAHMWLHESERVYGDRLVSPEDLKKYNDLAQGQARKIFSQFPVDKFYAKENADPLVFCHFCEDIEEHTYDQVRDSASHVGAFTPSTRVVSRRGYRGWSLVQI